MFAEKLQRSNSGDNVQGQLSRKKCKHCQSENHGNSFPDHRGKNHLDFKKNNHLARGRGHFPFFPSISAATTTTEFA